MKLIIIGNNPMAEIANQYFNYDSPYRVVGFSVERDNVNSDIFLGKSLVPFDEIEKHFDPKDHSFFVTLGYDKMNQDRTRLYELAKIKGYTPASYISSKAFVWHNVIFGEHCFIFENNTIQPFVEIGSNVIMWSGNHIGHHTKINDNCFLSSHVVISGLCNIGKNCFFGVNSTIANNLTIGDFCLIGSAANITKHTEHHKVYVGNPAKGIRKVLL